MILVFQRGSSGPACGWVEVRQWGEHLERLEEGSVKGTYEGNPGMRGKF